jgi:hypothetical protein
LEYILPSKDKSMVFEVTQMHELPMIFEVLHRKTKAFHLGDEIVICNPPLPDSRDISV